MKILTLITIFFSITTTYSQQLKPTPFDLGPNEYISDVDFFEPLNAYVIVGNFTSINGIPRRNIAFLDESLTYLLPEYPIYSSGGIFQTVACYNNHIYVGGIFSSIQETFNNGPGPSSVRKGFFKLSYILNNLVLSPFEGDIIGVGSVYSIGGVHDMEIYGDSLFIGGSTILSGLTYLNNILCFDLTNADADGELLYTNFAAASNGSYGEVYDIEKFNNQIYICGSALLSGTYDDVINKINSSGVKDNSFNTIPYGSYASVPLYYHLTYFEKSPSIYSSYDYNTQGNGNGLFSMNGSQVTTFLPTTTVAGSIREIQSYKSEVYRAQQGNSNFYTYNYVNYILSTDKIFQQGNSTFNFLGDNNRALSVSRNHLFVSAPNLTTIDNQPRIGLAIFCLEPYYMAPFTIFDTVSCAGKSINFELDSVKYASGYNWRYTGQGVEINGSSITNGGIDLWGGDKNTAVLDFTSGFTPGYLIVKAFSECNEKTSDSTFIYINQRLLPQFTALSDTNITCSVDSILLNPTILSSYTSSGWFDFQGVFSSGDSITASSAGNYTFRLTDSLGCQNFDTLSIGLDTISPNVVTSPLSPSINCLDTNITLHVSSDSANTISYWHINTIYFNDSVSINSPGTYTAISENVSNGCKDSVFVLLPLNYTPPDFTISGYSSLPSVGYLDTLNCIKDSLTLDASPSNSNTISYWTDSLGTQFNSDTTLFLPGDYLLFSQNSISGCLATKIIRIAIDTAVLNYSILDTVTLNCSSDSALVEAIIYGTNTSSFWTDSSAQIFANPFYAQAEGNYYLIATNLYNGCSTSDSFKLIKTNEILFASNEYLICDGLNSTIYSTAIYDGILTYSWSNGSTDSSTSVIGGLDQSILLTVVNSDQSCMGSNLLDIKTPPAPIDSFLVFKPCNSSPTGIIVANISGGIPPFQYSMDGTVFQNNSQFDSLSLGSYQISVKDSMDCIYEFPISINEDANLPIVNFLVSTYSFIEDTIFIANISNPTPDSVVWEFPIEANLINTDPIYPTISFQDTGSFEIKLLATIGACQFEKSKILYVTEVDTNVANFTNSNGIELVNIYPNPSNGFININVKFFKQQQSSIVFYTSQGIPIHTISNTETFEINKSLNLINSGFDTGIYLIKIIAEFDVKYFNLVVTY